MLLYILPGNERSTKDDTFNKRLWPSIEKALVDLSFFSNIRVFPAYRRHSPNAVSMLGQRRRRWTNIETALGQCLAFAGLVVNSL